MRGIEGFTSRGQRLGPIVVLLLLVGTFQSTEQFSLEDTEVSKSVKCSYAELEGNAYEKCINLVDEEGAVYLERDGSMNLYTYCCTIKSFKDCMVKVVEETCGKRMAVTDYTEEWVDEKVADLMGKSEGSNKHVCSRADFQFARGSPLCWPNWGLMLLAMAAMFLIIGMVICFAITIFKMNCAKSEERAEYRPYVLPNPGMTTISGK